jgi:biotin--protein ligase
LVFGGFEYQSEKGTRAAALEVVREALATGSGAVPERLRVYYNGGGVFVDAESFKDRGVEVVARYTDKLAVEGGDAAMVYCKVGEGGALLSGPHPEYVPIIASFVKTYSHQTDSPVSTSTAMSRRDPLTTAKSSTP